MRVVVLSVLAVVACSDAPRELARAPESVRVEPAPAVTPRGPADTVEVTLSFDDRATHHIDVEAVVPAGGPELELMMAVWTPGSYLVREYARHVERLTAATLEGAPLAVTKSRKNRWTVATGGAERVVVRYRVYARELSVRTNFVDSELAVLNGAPTFLAPVGAARAYDVRLVVPDAWPNVVTALQPHPSGDPHRYLAPSYDALVDMPIVAGTAAIYEFAIEGVPHRLATFGEGTAWKGAAAAADVEAIAREQARLWRVVPYDRYAFLNVLTNSGGGNGLEHQYSTLMTAGRWMSRNREDYLRWLGLVSHEFFHTWNVKRLRPVELGPFDYENEVHTKSLWVAEGVTSYYDDLLLRRAGIMDTDEYLDALSAQIDRVQKGYGRNVQSLAMASYDAWISYYRADENTPNVGVDYYRKGAVVGWLLDVEIRRRTGGARSLDDVMRLAYERYAGDAGYTPAQFREVVADVAGEPLDAFFAAAVDGTDELDFTPALSYYGLEFGKPAPKGDDDETAGWLGARMDGARVRHIPRDTPAYAAGLNVDDEIVAIDDYRVRSGELDGRLARYRPGDEVELLVARRGAMMRLRVALGEAPPDAWKLRRVRQPSFAQTRHLNEWLGGPPKR